MSGLMAAVACSLVAGVLASGFLWFQLASVGSNVLLVPEPNNTQHNKALHPTARSVVVFAALSLDSKLVVISGRRVSLIVVLLRPLGCNA